MARRIKRKDAKSYNGYLKDKTVAIVGASSHLIGKKEGEFIDSHDVVVRTNNSSVIPSELHEDYGSRTDVGYLWHPIMRFSPYQKSVSQNMKYVFLSQNRHFKTGMPVRTVSEDIDWLKRHNIVIASEPWRVSDTRHLEYLCYLECKVSPNAGMIATCHLLRQPLKSLYVTGFSFHREGSVEFGKEGTYRIYYDNKEHRTNNDFEVDVNNLFDITEDEYNSGKRWFSGHSPVMEEKVFFKWVANDPRIKTDSYLSSLAP